MSNRSATGEVKLVVSATIQNTMDDGTPVASASISSTPASGRLDDGVSADEINRAWIDKDRALATGVSEDIDFYDLGSLDIGAGAGNDPLGQALTFEEIVTVMITQTGGTGRLQINATNPSNPLAWMPSLTVANGGALRNDSVFLMHRPGEDGLDITDASSHMVRFGASGGNVTYTIVLLGRHDDNESSSSSQSTKSSLSSSSSSTSSTLSTLSSSSTSTLSSSSSHSRSSSSTLSSSSTSTLSSSSSSSSHSISSSSTLSSSSTSSLSSSSSTLSSSSSSTSSLVA